MAAKAQQAQTGAQAPLDERFDLSAWEGSTGKRSEEQLATRPADELAEAEGEAEEADADNEPVLPPLTLENLEEFKKKQQKRGIIYVSRIPPGMTAPKVRHIFSQFGEVGRIYLQPKDKDLTGAKRKRASHFSEGWIEFLSKRVARTAAEMLNAQPIGALGGSAPSSRRSQGNRVTNRWKDDVWTMKYLKGFRWPMLMEQMCTSRAATSTLLTQPTNAPRTPRACAWSSRSRRTSSATISRKSSERASSAPRRSAASLSRPSVATMRTSSGRLSFATCVTSAHAARRRPPQLRVPWNLCWTRSFS